MRIGVQVRLDNMLRGLRWLGHSLAEAAERRGGAKALRDAQRPRDGAQRRKGKR